MADVTMGELSMAGSPLQHIGNGWLHIARAIPEGSLQRRSGRKLAGVPVPSAKDPPAARSAPRPTDAAAHRI